jgi:serine/threonine-protein kinase
MSLPKTRWDWGTLTSSPIETVSVRSEPLFINFKDRLFPSFALQLTLKYLDLDLKDLQLGYQLKFNSKTIPIYGNNKMLIDFKSGILYYSVFDVINNKIPPEAFKDKIVIIAPSAAGIGVMQITPTAFNVPPVKIVANVIDNIISNDHILRPNWALILELLMIIFSASDILANNRRLSFYCLRLLDKTYLPRSFADSRLYCYHIQKVSAYKKDAISKLSKADLIALSIR